MAHLLVGSLAHSRRWRGYPSASMDQPHLVEGLGRIACGLGGVTRRWLDRMATVCQPATGRVTATFSGIAKHSQSKRDPSQSCPFESTTFIGDNDVRYQNPEIVLLHKAAHTRPKDSRDFHANSHACVMNSGSG